MPGEHMQSAKVVLILCSCFFAYGVSLALDIEQQKQATYA